MQREVPDEINIAACKFAKENGVTTVLDLGGADAPMPDEFLSLLDIISPNKTELKRIVGKDINVSNTEEIIKALEEIREKSGNKNLKLLLKLGSKGALFIDTDNNILSQHAFHFDDLKIVDTTGAGDCFTGSFVARLSDGNSIEDCLRYATGSAYLAITKFGAMPSMPKSEDVNNLLKRI
jgi:ribokinase